MRLRLLVSYHYHRNTDLAALVAELGGDVDLFADSGAYSAATTGATIRLTDYAAWLRDWASLWTVQAGLDVIGDHEATAANTAALRDAGCDVLPTFHVGSPWPVLEGLCATNRYIALGGMALHAVGASKQRPLMAWLVRCFRTAREHGTVFHGFGFTSAQIVKNLPFYSIDSSSYLFGQRWGLAYLWNAPAWRMESVLFRNPAEVRPHAALFRSHGLDPARVIDPSFMRAGTDHAAEDRTDVSAAGARAYTYMERSLAHRHQTAPPPLPRADDTGTKVYLALGGAADSDRAPLRRLVADPTPETVR
ncbi:hypothetical protein PH213_20410 [Streptomyces sp. SRF1]|uniref:hypothetical protein n=1 Tax=Streptomyces sp. SRF1 TaxID=1549642 RepID=UPI0025B2714F|nr:hypothetical protein [Streptomyces sp. SRF1]MDN3056870.1 hypothetical protein [Streptomyces sp. SRF1]